MEQEPQDIIDNGMALIGESEVFGNVNFAEVPAEHYFDLTFQWDVTDWALVTLTATNLLDNQPHVVGFNIGSTAFNSGNIFPSSYDPLGRRFAGALRLKF